MLKHWVTDYLNFIKYEKRYSQHTYIAYEADLFDFISYVDRQFNVEAVSDLSHFHLRSWLASFKDNGLEARSVNRKLSVVNSFFKFLLKKQVIDSNPAGKLHALKLPERLPSYVKENETELLFEEI